MSAPSAAVLQRLEQQFIKFLQTGVVQPGLFTEDVFVDFTRPWWRTQVRGVGPLRSLRTAGHPAVGLVPRWRTDRTDRGFVIEFEERWLADGKEWYAREMARADVANGAIENLSIYCTGDWDPAVVAEHARQEVMLRP